MCAHSYATHATGAAGQRECCGVASLNQVHNAGSKATRGGALCHLRGFAYMIFKAGACAPPNAEDARVARGRTREHPARLGLGWCLVHDVSGRARARARPVIVACAAASQCLSRPSIQNDVFLIVSDNCPLHSVGEIAEAIVPLCLVRVFVQRSHIGR